MEEESKRPIRFNEHTKLLLEKRKQEEIKKDVINEFNIQRGQGLTSATTQTSTEETRLLMEYMDRANIFNIANRNKERGKALTFRKFFRSKRNQQVEVYSKCGAKSLYTEGKVDAIGRDFVMLTNLKDRIWIPYSAIDSANIPYGIPNYSNTHQHFLYDNDLRSKLITNFGATVAKRDILKQQFYEETLRTNLESWKDTWVEVYLDEQDKRLGKIKRISEGKLTLAFFKKTEDIDINFIKFIGTVRLLSIFKHAVNKFIRNDQI